MDTYEKKLQKHPYLTGFSLGAIDLLVFFEIYLLVTLLEVENHAKFSRLRSWYDNISQFKGVKTVMRQIIHTVARYTCN